MGCCWATQTITPSLRDYFDNRWFGVTLGPADVVQVPIGIAVFAHQFADEGEPRQNGYAERLMRTITEEEVALTEYRDFADAYAQIGRFLDDVYQHKRIHSALGYLTPAEFEAAYHARLLTPVVLP